MGLKSPATVSHICTYCSEALFGIYIRLSFPGLDYHELRAYSFILGGCVKQKYCQDTDFTWAYP